MTDEPAHQPTRPWPWLALALGIVALPFLPLIWGSRTGIVGDNADLHVPIFRWVWASLRHGASPLWAGWDFAGHSVAGMGQAAIFYPPNAVFGVVGAVTAFRWWTMFHLWCATTGAFVWSWRQWGSRNGAAVTAIVYGLNGQLVLHLVHANFTMATTWFPWLLLGLDRLLARGRPRDVLAYVWPLLLIALAGHPQMLWAALVATGVMAMARSATRDAGWRPWARYAGATAVTMCLAAPQLLPQLFFSRTSVRPALTSDEALRATARLPEQMTALFPGLEGGGAGVPGMSADFRGASYYHELGNHIGLAAVLLAVVAAWAHRRNRAVVGLSVLAMTGAVLALASSTPFGALAFHVVPLADRFRFWPRYMVLTNLAVAGLAGLGAHTVLVAPRRWRAVIVSGALAAAVLAPVAVGLGGSLVDGGALVVAVAMPLAAAMVLVAATTLAAQRPALARAAVITSCTVPAVLFTLAAPWRNDALSPAEARAFFDPSTATWAPHDAPGGVDRWASERALDRGRSTVRDTARVDGYDPLLQATYADLTDVGYFGGVTTDRLWSTAWTADVLRLTTVAGDTTPPGWIDMGTRTEDGQQLSFREPRLPEAYVVGRVEIASIDRIADALDDPTADFIGTVRLDPAEGRPGAFAGLDEAGSAGTVIGGSMDRHGHGRWQVEADRPGALVISSAWLDGWEATVNGVAVPVGRANGLVLAIPLVMGGNDVQLRFTPPGLRVGAATGALGAVVLMAWVLAPATRRRHQHHHHSPEELEFFRADLPINSSSSERPPQRT